MFAAADPQARHLHVTTSLAFLARLTIDPATGAIAHAPGSPLTNLGDPEGAIAFAPNAPFASHRRSLLRARAAAPPEAGAGSA